MASDSGFWSNLGASMRSLYRNRFHRQRKSSNSTTQNNNSSDTYQQLDHEDSIRLVYLLPSSNANDPIELTMIPARLGEKPRYRALSYEWGLQDDQHDPVIMINNRCPLRVRKNLYEALKEIRASPGEFANYPLWIDAICIDQRQEYGEKPHQVRLMGKIFGQAALVIAWLGLAGRSSDLAIDALEACSQYGRLSLPKHCCFVTRILEPPEPKQTFDAYPPWMIMKAIMLLCNRSYWRRVWILQEIHMSRSLVVRCGSRSITDTDLNRAFHTLRSFECIPHTRYKETHLRNYYRDLTKFLCITGSSVPLRHLQARENGYRSFGQWLQICVDGDFQATERRDYLFALLAISNDVRDVDMMVDYDVPLRTVMQNALPVIRRSYCAIKEDDRKSWDSFSREVDKLMGFHFERDPYTPQEFLSDDSMSTHLETHWYQRVFHYIVPPPVPAPVEPPTPSDSFDTRW